MIKWAGSRGLVVDEKQLKEHFNNHLEPSVEATPSPKGNTKSKRRKRQAKKVDGSGKFKQNSHQKTSSTNAKVITTQVSEHQAQFDEKFLNEIISLVFQGLTEGEFDLKVEHGFKAIELKQKLAENSNVENLLLELLNEIRRQELPFLRQSNNNPSKA